MKGKMKCFRKKLCAFGLAAAAVAGGVAAPVAVNMSHADEAFATQNRTANFNKGYSSAADPGTFMVNIAKAQIGRTKTQFNYTEAWCADFISDCAILAGQATAIPSNGSVLYLEKAILNAGGYRVNEDQVKAGDIVICRMGNSYPHVGMVNYRDGNGRVHMIEGNVSNKVIDSNTLKNYKPTWNSKAYNSVYYIRPNYKGSVPPPPTPGPDINNYWPLEDGYYTLKTAVGNRFLDVSGMGTADRTNVQIWDAFGAHSGQIFKVARNGAGTGYYIQNLNSGTFVDTTIKGRNTNNPVGADNVMIYKEDGSKGQQWNLEDEGNGNYLVKNLYNYYLDVDNGVDANGRNVNTWHKNGSAAQQWKFTRVSGKKLANVAEGDYMIYSKVGNRVLNAAGDGTGNGTNLQIYDPVDSAGNVFTVQKDGRFVTKIKNKAANRMVDSQGGKNTPENVQLWDYNNGYGQNWYVEDAGDGYVYIRNLWGYYLDVAHGVNANGTNVNTWHFNGNDNQKWKFVKYTKTNVTGIILDSASRTVKPNDVFTLTATVFPSNATNKNKIWYSSNTSVATVDSNGKVTAKATGTATITVKTEDGSKTAACTVSVIANDTRTGIYFVNNKWTYLKNGKTQESFNGLIYGNNRWYYMTKGVQNKNYVGLTWYNGAWWYIKNGTIDKSFTGIVEHNKNSWYVRNGKVDKNYTGLAYYNNVWWYVNQGYVGKSHRGLVYYNNKWWYINKGRLDKSFNSLYNYNNKWWYIKSGTIDKSYKGLIKYNGNLWYVTNGAVDKSYNGKFKYNGKTITVKEGWGGKA